MASLGGASPPPPPPRASQTTRKSSRSMKLKSLLAELPKASAQSAALWMAGDAICQKLEKSEKRFDFRRTGVNALYGGAFLGPVGHFWYHALEAGVSRALPGGGVRMIAAKLVADLGLFGPVHLAAFLAWNAAAAATDPRRRKAGAAGGGNNSGDGGVVIWDAVKISIGKDFVPALVVDTFYWLPVQAVNFAVMPVSKQLLFMNAACAVDAAFLSWLGSHSGALTEGWKELKESKQKEKEKKAKAKGAVSGGDTGKKR